MRFFDAFLVGEVGSLPSRSPPPRSPALPPFRGGRDLSWSPRGMGRLVGKFVVFRVEEIMVVESEVGCWFVINFIHRYSRRRHREFDCESRVESSRERANRRAPQDQTESRPPFLTTIQFQFQLHEFSESSVVVHWRPPRPTVYPLLL